jgi:hypothetical protein
MKRHLAVILALTPLGAPLAKTPVMAKSDHRGVLYQQLSPQRWRVGFDGLGAADPPAIQHLILRTAAKLTLARGFDWFEPIGERPEPVETAAASDPQRPLEPRADFGLRLRWGMRCASGWAYGPAPGALCAGGGADPSVPFQATTQIMLGHGVAPANGVALNARSVLKETAR